MKLLRLSVAHRPVTEHISIGILWRRIIILSFVTEKNKSRSSASRGGRRSARGRSRERKIIDAPAYVKRQIPFYEFLGEEGLVRLEEQADWLMQEIGLEFRDDPNALEIWKKAGAEVKGTRVRLDNGMATRAMQDCAL